MKKILILGGKPIGSCEIVERANKKGLYTIVSDYLEVCESKAKQIASEHWKISTSEVDVLAQKCVEEKVDAIVTGVHEFNIERKIELCERLGLPQYCTREQWDLCENKAAFKQQCEQHGISIAKTYNEKDKDIEFPVIVKPVDGSGSRGFSVYQNRQELKVGIKTAEEYSASGKCLIEEYIQCDACIIHYTALNGEIIFSGMSDKYSQRLEGGASVMALQLFPSRSMQDYLNEVNAKAIAMFQNMGITDGPIWIEAFNDKSNKRFIFNEMGYRFGGSMTNYPVEHFYGIDQIELMLANATGMVGIMGNPESFISKSDGYCILPIHVKAGKISSVEGIEEARDIEGVEQIVFVHHEGDVIQNWGTAQQVFCYLHISYNEISELEATIKYFHQTVHVKNENNQEMLFYLFDFEKIGIQPM